MYEDARKVTTWPEVNFRNLTVLWKFLQCEQMMFELNCIGKLITRTCDLTVGSRTHQSMNTMNTMDYFWAQVWMAMSLLEDTSRARCSWSSRRPGWSSWTVSEDDWTVRRTATQQSRWRGWAANRTNRASPSLGSWVWPATDPWCFFHSQVTCTVRMYMPPIIFARRPTYSAPSGAYLSLLELVSFFDFSCNLSSINSNKTGDHSLSWAKPWLQFRSLVALA